MIYVGTCGFAYKDWLGAFYPATARQSEMLAYYARCFPAVEIDSSFYGVPAPSTIARMNGNTPAGFRFCFKVPQTVSHAPDKPARVHPDASAFVESVAPIVEAGKFGAALLQFPNSFKPADGGEAYLERVVQALHPLRLVAEFRHRDWQTARTQERLCDLGVGWCNVDMPRHESLLAPGADVTSPTGYVRFHGRNAAQWWSGTNVTRYDYDYTAEELEPWANRIAEIDERAEATYAFFNNHARGNAARNAEAFADLLRERYGDDAGEIVPRLRKPPSQGSLF